MDELQSQLVACAADVGLAVRTAIAALPLHDRVQRIASSLKPPPALSALPDERGEQAAFARLAILADALGCEIRVIVDPSSGTFHTLRSAKEPSTGAEHQHLWVYLDAVDGTVKLAGLCNGPGVARVVNDGCWAVGIAFTAPGTTPLAALHISDFTLACIIDGSADLGPAHGSATRFPPAVAAVRQSQGPAYATHALVWPVSDDEGSISSVAFLGPRICTSSCPHLHQVFAYHDAFQAFDKRTQGPQDEALACALYARLINRNAGGAFDVLRSYGNLSALLRTMLSVAGGERGEDGSKDSECIAEPQGGVFTVVNENLANLLPCVPIVLGAGGLATDFDGTPLLHHPLVAGRTHVLYAANAVLHASTLRLVHEASASAHVHGGGSAVRV